jgi:hypothetical protein
MLPRWLSRGDRPYRCMPSVARPWTPSSVDILPSRRPNWPFIGGIPLGNFFRAAANNAAIIGNQHNGILIRGSIQL